MITIRRWSMIDKINIETYEVNERNDWRHVEKNTRDFVNLLQC